MQANNIIKLTAILLLTSFPDITLGVNPDRAVGILKIGIPLSLSGSLKAYGEEIRDAAKIAVDMFREENPSLASHVQLLVEDDHSDAAGARKATQKLINRRVAAVIGSVSPQLSTAVLGTLKKSGKVFVSPFACDRHLAKHKSVILACFPEYWQSIPIAEYAITSLKSKRIGLLTNSEDPKAKALSESFQRRVTRHGIKVFAEDYQSSDPRWDFHLDNLLRNGVDTLLFSSTILRELEVPLKKIALRKLAIPVLGTDMLFHPTLRHIGPNSSKNPVLTIFPVPFYHKEMPTPQAKDFFARFTQKSQRYPSRAGAAAYDALLLLLEGFKASQSTRVGDLVAAVKRATVPKGLIGPMRMSSFLHKSTLILANRGGSIELAGRITPHVADGSKLRGKTGAGSTKRRKQNFTRKRKTRF